MKPLPTKKFPPPLFILFVMVLALNAVYPKNFLVAKTVHLIGLISWFAGLFYLPRLFVYHAESEHKEVQHTLCIMEWKLFFYIMNPAAVVTLFSGGWMLYCWDWVVPRWMHLKIFLVFGLLVFHGCCWIFVLRFRDQRNQRGGLFYRWFNEIPTIVLIGIVCLVVLKPWS